ncbi:hypothetical protein SAMN05421734_11027 [Pelagirhabdus alkalitolerans]|uniref:Circular bacteriocin, circularin A/uberolysin family n=1 Tax=Pelagirhabdus alkalitolerans TaxID=1612202 RepID=A0A1G6M5U6_9BACI|nr:hypothetical protein [Pelagirhabdus alkalitolerans]SDC50345.1 hypothetical protein SAMN05421734_11027 [Pelagirhabdus alkalitolerans]
MNSSVLKREIKILVFFSVAMLVFLLVFNTKYFAAVNLGISSGTATAVYHSLKWIGWGATAAAIISSFGLGALGAQAIWAAVKKWSLNKFITW